MSTASTPERGICSLANPSAVSPTMGYSAGTQVRTRPRLPTMEAPNSQRTDHEGSPGHEEKMEDLSGVIHELGNTDFVSKYSRRRRASGTASPSPSCCSLPMSPMSPVMSPGTKSPPNVAEGRGTITLTRMRSIKLKLEAVKESQDRAEQAGRALKKHMYKRRSGVVVPPKEAVQQVTKADRYPARENHKPLQQWDRDSRSADSHEGRGSSSESLLGNGATSHTAICEGTGHRENSLSAKSSTSDAPCVGSVPTIGCVPLGDDLHTKRAWSEPSYLIANSRGDNNDSHSLSSQQSKGQISEDGTDAATASDGPLDTSMAHITVESTDEKGPDSDTAQKVSIESEGQSFVEQHVPSPENLQSSAEQHMDSMLSGSVSKESQPKYDESTTDKTETSPSERPSQLALSSVCGTTLEKPLGVMPDDAQPSPPIGEQGVLPSSAVDEQVGGTILKQPPLAAAEKSDISSSTEDSDTSSVRSSDAGLMWRKPGHTKSKSLDMSMHDIVATFDMQSFTIEKVSDSPEEGTHQLETNEFNPVQFHFEESEEDSEGRDTVQKTKDKCLSVLTEGKSEVPGVPSGPEAEDEGVGGESDNEAETNRAFTGLTRSSDMARTEQVMTEAPSGEGTGKEVQLADHLKRLMKAGNTTNGSGKMANGRFLTHPPVRERSAPKEIGSRSVDSNGLGSLREGSEPVPDTGELTSQVSMVSIDSPSETTELPTYRDVVLDVMSEGNDVDKFERRNSKSLKQKSKSDPSGEKQKLKENVDLPGVLNTHTQSTPVLAEQEHLPQEQEFKVTGKDRPISKSDNVLISQTDTGSQALSHTLDVDTMKMSSEDSLEDSPRPLTRQDKQSRRAFKIRNRDMKGKVDTDKNRKIDEDALRVITSERRIITKTSTQIHLPQNSSNCNIQQHESLIVPGKKHSKIHRSQSSVSVFSGSTSDTFGTGARPKLLREINSTRKLRPSLPTPPCGLGAGGSVPEHASSKPREKPVAPFSPSLEPIFSGSTLSLLDTPYGEKEKRDHIVEELVSTERQYVETLHMLVEKYMIPMKSGILDSNLVDDIFYKINEIYMHHAMFLAFLDGTLQRWDANTTIGDVIHKIFSKQTVIESYVSFIENFPRAEKVLDDLSTKSYFSRFVEQCERETRSKLPLKAQIVKPAQRIPRYELLLRRLIENTTKDHPDYELLLGAEEAIHLLLLRINSVKESKHEEDLQETLRKLELLLITDLVAPERLYHRHDMVQVLNRKDQCCMWLFSDLVVLTSIKRKSGPVNRKSTLLLQSPSGQDFVENTKHKVWLKVPLDDLELVKGLTSLSRKQLVDREQLEEDSALLTQIADLSSQLKCSHQTLDECVLELRGSVNRHLSEHQLKAPPPDACKVELMATMAEGVANITVVFPSPEKKSSWESAFVDVKQKLATMSDGKPPEFLQALQITKTRAGMQFSCAAPIDGLSASQHRDVWVCNSDGYVGHMCLLSLQPEPIVTLNTPVPGCNSRILCICAVPAFHSCKRKGSIRRPAQMVPLKQSTVRIHVEALDTADDDEEDDASDFSSSGSEDGSEDDDITLRIHQDVDPRSRSPSPGRPGEAGRPTQDPLKSTMWLGTEDGCIHIFLSTDNIKTTKNKVKMQQNAGVLCIVHLDQKVFVSLANGEVVVYRRNHEGVWDMNSPLTVTLGNISSPVVRMLPVAGRLWCACQNEIIVLHPASLETEHQFAVNMEAKRSIQCLACSGQGVWIAGQGSSKVILYHATTYEHLLDVSIAQAVAQKLQTADDIIRQHKTACLRITALLACKDLLWVGTSAGVVLTLPMPKVSAATVRGSLTAPMVTGLVHGHTGHVRFLTTVEMPSQSKRSSDSDFGDAYNITSKAARLSRRASLSIHMLTMATKMLVISGGDGYEDFRNNSANEAAGRDDSTNHLLLWQV